MRTIKTKTVLKDGTIKERVYTYDYRQARTGNTSRGSKMLVGAQNRIYSDNIKNFKATLSKPQKTRLMELIQDAVYNYQKLTIDQVREIFKQENIL